PGSRAGPRSTRPRSRHDLHRSPRVGRTSRFGSGVRPSLADAETGEDRGDDLVIHAAAEDVGECAERILEIDGDEIVGAVLAKTGRSALERGARIGQQTVLAC